jgi:hypothetical protein
MLARAIPADEEGGAPAARKLETSRSVEEAREVDRAMSRSESAATVDENE